MGEGFEDQIKKFKNDPAVFTYHGTAMDIHILSICSCNVPAISQKGIFDLVVQTETQESWFIPLSLPLTPIVNWPLTLNGYLAAGTKGQRVTMWVGMGEATWARRLAGGLPQGFSCHMTWGCPWRLGTAKDRWASLRNTSEGQSGSLMGWMQGIKQREELMMTFSGRVFEIWGPRTLSGF